MVQFNGRTAIVLINQKYVCNFTCRLNSFNTCFSFVFHSIQEAHTVQLKYNLESGYDKLAVVWKNKAGEWETVSYVELSEDELKKEWVCLRTKFHLRYSVSDSSKYREQLIELLQSTRKKICETNKPVLKVANTEIVLKKDKGLVGIGKNAKISAAVQQTKTVQSASPSNQFEVLNISLNPGEEDASVDDISSLFSSEFQLSNPFLK